MCDHKILDANIFDLFSFILYCIYKIEIINYEKDPSSFKEFIKKVYIILIFTEKISKCSIQNTRVISSGNAHTMNSESTCLSSRQVFKIRNQIWQQSLVVQLSDSAGCPLAEKNFANGIYYT